MTRKTIKSYAKINLGLDVLGTLPNGYHSLKMIMQTISLYDSLYFEKRKDSKIVLKTNLAYLPVNEKNIVYQAIKLFMDTMGISGGIYASITKRIPVAAGMAGGSGNAAAALKAMNELFGTHLSIQELSTMGVRLGADVPYCLMGGTAISEGIGDILTPLPAPPKAKVLIVKPRISVSTKEVYTQLNIDDTTRHPNMEACIEAIRTGSLTALCNNLGNVLESVTVRMHPVISEIKAEMLQLGARGSLMSGSGPTVFGLFDNEELSIRAFNHYRSVPEYSSGTFLCDFI